MSKDRTSSRIALAAGIAALTCTTVNADMAPLDTESKAQASLAVPPYLNDTLGQDLIFLAGGAQRTAQEALQLLDAATTWDEIAASPSGVTVACASSGSLTARAAGTANTLEVEFQGCAHTSSSLVFELKGTSEIALFDHSLTPAAVAGIRLGSADQDLIERFFFADSPATAQIQSRNLRMTGRIPVRRETTDWEFYGPLDYQITGFYQAANPVTLPDGSTGSRGVRYAAENLAVSGHRYERRIGDLQVFDLAFDYEGGLISSGYFDTLAGISDTRSTTLGELKVRALHAQRANDWDDWLDVDGVADIQWAEGNGAGCVSGEYDVRTTQPWHYSSSQPPYQYTEGASRINDQVSVRFTAHPTPSIRLNVRQVGNFRYEDSVQNLVGALPCGW